MCTFIYYTTNYNIINTYTYNYRVECDRSTTVLVYKNVYKSFAVQMGLNRISNEPTFSVFQYRRCSLSILPIIAICIDDVGI